eukprot:COSAG01_NODE_1833_length_9107_cov_7.147313_4_plen_91_part_00
MAEWQAQEEARARPIARLPAARRQLELSVVDDGGAGGYSSLSATPQEREQMREALEAVAGLWRATGSLETGQVSRSLGRSGCRPLGTATQ